MPQLSKGSPWHDAGVTWLDLQREGSGLAFLHCLTTGVQCSTVSGAIRTREANQG